jgi:uncharacterized repeat protein (TIGR01451 family)
MRTPGKHHHKRVASSLTSSQLKVSGAVSLALLITLGCGFAYLARAPKASATRLSHLSQSISVHASGLGSHVINFADGRDVLTSYSGPAALTQALQQNAAQPLALASADFDEDGVPDLICGYGQSSSGIISWLRGNVDSIYPNSPEAHKRKIAGEFTHAPFLSPARVFALPIEPEFLGAGDFDGDGHWDVVAASRTSDGLYWLPGDGRGGFGEPRRVALPGRVTAFVTGEINRPDGLDDVVVAVNGQDGPKALVFEGPEGALRASPEIFSLPAEASSLALGQLEGDPMTDLAIAAGNQLLIVQGRDRKLSLSKRSRGEVADAAISILDFPYALRSLAIDHFTSNDRTELAMLSDDGSLSLLRAGSTGRKKSTRGAEGLQTEALDRKTWSESTRLVPARISTMNVSSLLIVDSKSNQIDVVTCNSESDVQKPDKKAPPRTDPVASMRLDMDSGPIAALPMRLNSDALNDLIILRRGQSVPAAIETAPGTTFTVTNTNDSGAGSLRQAIIDANANVGADAIEFNIPGPGPFVITLTDPLPPVSDPVTIDGTSQPGFSVTPLIEITRFPAPGAFALVVTAGNSSVRGLYISARHPLRIFDDGIKLQSNGDNVIEGNTVETDNGAYQLLIENSGNNQIGDAVTGSGNTFVTLDAFGVSAGIKIAGNDNKIQGNTVAALHGAISIDQGTGNLIGGSVAGAGNQITASTTATGVRIETDLNMVKGNSITASTPGISVSGRNNSIGGTVATARNVIFGNRFGDVSVEGSDNLVQGNVIGVGAFGGGSIGHIGVGVCGSRNAIGGSVDGARNIIAGHMGAFPAGAGVDIQGPDNEIGRNFIGTDITGKLAIPNTIGIQVRAGARVIIEGNVVSGNNRYGIFLSGAIGASVQNNLIGVAADGVQPLGNEVGLLTLLTNGLQTSGKTDSKVLVSTSPGTAIEGNVISSNGTGIILVNAIDALVRNNLIGVAADGVHPAGNTNSGVVVTQSPNTRIEENVISSNGEHGISIGGTFILLGAGSGSEAFFGGAGTTVSGNKIGTDIEGIRPLGNGKDGIFVENQSQTHKIVSNIIAFNNRNGVCLPNKPSDPTNIPEDPAIQIHISENSIFSNLALGIDLGDPGVTANHFEDPSHHEANHAQNFPVLNRATTDGSGTTIDGSLHAAPNATFTIEFFSNSPDTVAGFHAAATADCIRQGQVFVGSVTVKTDGSGKATISVALPISAPGGFISSTATSLSLTASAGNTSEFSACVQPKFLNADLSVEQSAAASAAPGSSLSYQVTVDNNGPDLAPNVVLTASTPANTTFESLVAPEGWTSRLPDVGGAGSIICGTAGLYPGTAATFTIMVKVSPGTADGAIITSSVSVSSGIPDLKPGNNSVTVTTVVSLTPPPPPPDVAADLSVDLKGSPDSVFAGDAITYALTVRNLGPATAKNVVLRQTVPVNTAFQTSTEVGGWSRDGPAVGGTGTITYTNTSLGSGGSATFTVVVKVNSDTPVGTTLLSAASVSSAADPNSDNNSLSVGTMTVARPPGPSVQSIAVSSNITVVGSDFVKVQVFIDDIGFSDPAKVRGGTQVIQKGKLIDGRSIAEAVPPGRVVKIKFRNSNGGETEVSFRN